MKDRMNFWNILKKDYEEKEVITIETPDGAKTFSRQYEYTPEMGVASVIYTCNDEQYHVVFFLTNHSLDIAIDALHDENADKDEFGSALKYSLNKALANYSLEITWEKSHNDLDAKVKMLTLNYAIGEKNMFD